MFTGFALRHEGDCYRMFDPGTQRVHTTRDVRWLHKMFYEEQEPNAEAGGNGRNLLETSDDEAEIMPALALTQ